MAHSSTSPALSTVGDRVRWTIERHLRLPHAEVARRLGITRQLLSRWVNNPDRPPGEESLQAIADLARIPVAWLRYGGSLPTGSGEAGDDAPPSADGSTTADADLRLRIGEIEEQDISDAMKAWKIAEIGAAYRAKALADLAAALHQEGAVAARRLEALLADHVAEITEGGEVEEIAMEVVRARRKERAAAERPPRETKPE